MVKKTELELTRSNKDITTLSLLIEELKNGIPSEEDDFILDGVVVENEKAESLLKMSCEIRRKIIQCKNFPSIVLIIFLL